MGNSSFNYGAPINNDLRYSSISLESELNKTLEKDASGYYKICLGAINSFNKKGEFYLADGFEDILTNPSSPLAIKLKEKNLVGEANHPAIKSNMSKQDFMERVLRIELNNTSHHIKSVFTQPTNISCGIPGKGNIIAVMGWVKPIGHLGKTLQDALDNPEQNVCFSVRSFTNDERIGGVTYKKFATIVTWDWVVSPGIKVANKLDTFGMESFNDITMDLETINNVYINVSQRRVSNEDESVLAYINSMKRKIDMRDDISDALRNW